MKEFLFIMSIGKNTADYPYCSGFFTVFDCNSCKLKIRNFGNLYRLILKLAL